MSNDYTVKAVKTLVIIMTTLIMVGLCLVVYSLFIRANIPASNQVSASMAKHDKVASDVDLVPFGTVTLVQPPGTQIVATTVAGQRLLLWLKGGKQEERIIFIDLTTGHTLGTIIVGHAS